MLVAAAPLDRAGELEAGEAVEELLEHHPDLGPGQRRARGSGAARRRTRRAGSGRGRRRSGTARRTPPRPGSPTGTSASSSPPPGSAGRRARRRRVAVAPVVRGGARPPQDLLDRARQQAIGRPAAPRAGPVVSISASSPPAIELRVVSLPATNRRLKNADSSPVAERLDLAVVAFDALRGRPPRACRRPGARASPRSGRRRTRPSRAPRSRARRSCLRGRGRGSRGSSTSTRTAGASPARGRRGSGRSSAAAARRRRRRGSRTRPAAATSSRIAAARARRNGHEPLDRPWSEVAAHQPADPGVGRRVAHVQHHAGTDARARGPRGSCRRAPSRPGPVSDENVAGSRTTATTSACRVIAQKPSPSGVCAVGCLPPDRRLAAQLR